MSPFHGAKLALFIGSDLLVYLRDDKPDIPFAGHWDLPGGGREGDESPEQCVLRETHEEFGLKLSPTLLDWRRSFHGVSGVMWFFAARVGVDVKEHIVFGDEGQRWALWPPEVYLNHPFAIDRLKTRLLQYLKET